MNIRGYAVRYVLVTALTGLLTVVGFVTPSIAATYYVATNGSDSYSGSESQPFRTITHAYGRAIAGDTIIVKPGTYTDFTSQYGLRLNRDGTASQPITVKSEQRGAAILDGQNRSDRPYVMWVSGHHNVVDGFSIRNGFLGGIVVFGDRNQIRHSTVHNNGNSGVSGSSNGQNGIFSNSSAEYTIYWANHVHHNGRIAQNSNYDHGIYLNGDYEVVVNNIVTHNSAYGLHLAGGSTVVNTQIYNNTFAWNGRSGIMLWLQLSGVQIKNNILYKNAIYGIDTYDAHGTSVAIDRNVVHGNAWGTMRLNGGGSNFTYSLGTNSTADPLFANASASDFRLQATSPAVNTGLNLSAVPADYNAVPRPQGSSSDIGAHEYRSGTEVPAAPTNVRMLTSN